MKLDLVSIAGVDSSSANYDDQVEHEAVLACNEDSWKVDGSCIPIRTCKASHADEMRSQSDDIRT